MPQTYFRQVYITSNYSHHISNYSHHIETEQDEPQFIITLCINSTRVPVDGYI